MLVVAVISVEPGVDSCVIRKIPVPDPVAWVVKVGKTLGGAACRVPTLSVVAAYRPCVDLLCHVCRALEEGFGKRA